MKRGEGGSHKIITVGILFAFSRLIYIQIPFRGLLPVRIIIPCLSILTDVLTRPSQVFRYDMAVNKNDKGLIVAPYYINKVKAIYFKPEAQLRRQQFLTYDTARVEFEMTPDAKYWMASPLKSVFAGDMYTVKNTGRQNTYASLFGTYIVIALSQAFW